MKKYIQLTCEERYHIYKLKKQLFSLRFIAKSTNRNVSTISREIKRNTGKKNYRYKQAQTTAQKRHREKEKQIKINKMIRKYIKDGLEKYWSPQQISGRLKKDKKLLLSHETIYRHILKNKEKGGNLYTFLRHQNKKYKKRYGKNDYRGRIPQRVDIDERPAIVNKKTRVGDWEADLIVGKNHQGFMVTLAERHSRLYLATPIKRKTKELTANAIKALLKDCKNFVKTITFDNGREFNDHIDIAKNLNCKAYFAKPYHSWERGLNENHNGLLRQFFPKSMSFENTTTREVKNAITLINNRPRKCLCYNSPSEVFAKKTGIDIF
jgi:IS30 family transposase